MRNVKWLKKAAAMLLAGTLMCGTAAWTGAGFTQEVKADTIIGQTPTMGSLTIHKTGDGQPLKGAEFTLYKVMSLTPGENAGDFATYAIEESFGKSGILNDVIPDALDNYSAQEIEKKAVELAAWATNADNKVPVAGKETTAEGTGQAVFSDLALGYYLVVETKAPEGGYVAGKPFLVAIPSTDNYDNPAGQEEPGTSWVYNVEASPKNSKTTIEKEIDKTAQGDNLSTDASVKVGDYVPYKIATSIPDYSDPSYANANVTFTITDVMSKGLDIQNSGDYPVDVKVGGKEVTTGDDTYTLTAEPNAGETEADLTVNFVSAYIKEHAGEAVEITYYAKVTDDAVMGTTGNKNTPSLTISNNPNGGTSVVPGPDVFVYSFGLDVVKFTKEGESKPLAGAEFQLYREEVKDENKIGDPKETTQDGKISFTQLDEGLYYLVETKAPAGYALLANPIKVEITAKENETSGLAEGGNFTLKINDEVINTETGDYVSKQDQATGISTVAVENHKGFTLPATGGMGIVLFLAVGVAGIVAVSVLLTRKSKDAK